MYGRAQRLDTIQTAQMMCENEDSPAVISDCITRKMTPEDWQKYGPLNTRENKEIKKSSTRQ